MKMLRSTVATLNIATAKPVDIDPRVREQKRFYDSALWKRTRKAKLDRDPLCQACAAMGIATPADHVDHWVAMAKGGHATAPTNLVSLCISHHSMKTDAEQNGKRLPDIVPSAPCEVSFA